MSISSNLCSPSSRDDLIQIISPLLAILNGYDIKIESEDQISLIKKLFVIYRDYAAQYPYVNVTSHDPIKILSWTPYVLIEILHLEPHQPREIFQSASTLIGKNLKIEGVKIDREWTGKLTDSAMNGLIDSNEKVSIGKIGYYMAFKTASNTSAPIFLIKAVSQILTWLFRIKSGF